MPSIQILFSRFDSAITNSDAVEATPLSIYTDRLHGQSFSANDKTRDVHFDRSRQFRWHSPETRYLPLFPRDSTQKRNGATHTTLVDNRNYGCSASSENKEKQL